MGGSSLVQKKRRNQGRNKHEKYNGAKIEGHCQEEGNNATAIASDLVKNFSAIGLAFLTQKPELCIS
ncbi:hypothetical protein T4B_6624 [Trichinella pseudospiralis]|uniref:Uncharacterized protein n=1 Tax=Trichinella pseudospiralis TaxID=6337 RepID=A0A0V1EKN7_TRIPS|nr:hypothetical protein T4A_12573 [Trichinella pseudospiralis]KRZ33573.1 hypothetical protein T4B_6624 [Trichinella pseudospiralis]KRZ40367.1 hypothetical protein T4C_10860 [Trichinella pseudospiralis]